MQEGESLACYETEPYVSRPDPTIILSSHYPLELRFAHFDSGTPGNDCCLLSVLDQAVYNMTNSTLETNGTAPEPNGVLLPGTTVPEPQTTTSPPAISNSNLPYSFPGPTIKGRKTTTTLYEPSQLAASPIIPALVDLINVAFDHSHTTKAIPISQLRLPAQEDYIRQVGTDPGTFVYVVTWEDTGAPVATAGAHRYAGEVLMSEEAKGQDRSAFTRVKLPPAAERAEVWELKLMAVDIGFSGQGLASYLMKLVDGEVLKRRRRGGGEEGSCGWC